MAQQVGITYTLVGPDGTRAVFNDPADPDFVGYLNGEDGISGLDSPEVRESAENRVEEDGGLHGRFFFGRRPVVLTGIIWPDPDMIAANARMDRLARASAAMRADAVLSWTEEGSVAKRLAVRRQQPLRFSQRRPKQFQVALVSADARIVSVAENSVVISPDAASGDAGISSPISDPLRTSYAQSGQGFVANIGNFDSQPRFRVTGPITNPVVRNETTGEELRLVYTLGTGDWLDIDVAAKSILLNGTAKRYGALDWAASTWWLLPPGSSDVRLMSSSYSAGATLTVYWRHAWV